MKISIDIEGFSLDHAVFAASLKLRKMLPQTHLADEFYSVCVGRRNQRGY